jgi:hypothetical protein
MNLVRAVGVGAVVALAACGGKTLGVGGPPTADSGTPPGSGAICSEEVTAYQADGYCN